MVDTLLRTAVDVVSVSLTPPVLGKYRYAVMRIRLVPLDKNLKDVEYLQGSFPPAACARLGILDCHLLGGMDILPCRYRPCALMAIKLSFLAFCSVLELMIRLCHKVCKKCNRFSL